jgi:hypothetical protein
MVKLQTVLVSVAVVGVLLFAYRYLFNPQVLLGSSDPASVCPERWSYIDGLCKPTYEVNCMPFDPYTITSKVSACNLARTCGTGWPGKCA